MPRRPRLEIPECRSPSRCQPCSDLPGYEDFQRYLGCLAAAFAERGIALHTHVLMTNHVHLQLTTPAPGVPTKGDGDNETE